MRREKATAFQKKLFKKNDKVRNSIPSEKDGNRDKCKNRFVVSGVLFCAGNTVQLAVLQHLDVLNYKSLRYSC